MIPIRKKTREESAREPQDPEADEGPARPIREKKPDETGKAEECSPHEKYQPLEQLPIRRGKPEIDDLVVDAPLAELEEIIDQVHSRLEGQSGHHDPNAVYQVASTVHPRKDDAQNAGKRRDDEGGHARRLQPGAPRSQVEREAEGVPHQRAEKLDGCHGVP
ncbi:MAG: hypothetical protein ABSG63_17165 [Spirochaetia bacterium]